MVVGEVVVVFGGEGLGVGVGAGVDVVGMGVVVAEIKTYWMTKVLTLFFLIPSK